MFKAARNTLLQAYPNAPWRSQVQMFGVFAVGVLIIAVLAGVYLYVSVSAATLGRQTQEVQAEILELQRVNANLQTRLAEISSSAAMEARARDLGFQPLYAPELEYLAVPGYRPPREAALAPPPGPDLVPNAMPDALNQSLIEWLQEEILEPAGDAVGQSGESPPGAAGVP